MKNILFMAIMAMLLNACSKAKDNSQQSNKNLQTVALNDYKKEDEQVNSAIADSVKATSDQEELPKNKQATIDWDKKIIKTANIALELKDYASYNTNIHKSIKNFGAYIAGEEQSQTDGGIENTMTIKVPVEQFENLLSSFSGEGIKIIQKKITTEDVTGEVVDTRARIEAKKQVRNRYMDLLKQAKNMKEILEVQEEINNTQEAIESGTGRVTYLTHGSTYSTVNLRYFQYTSDTNPVDVKPSFYTKLSEAFKEGGSILATCFYLLPPFGH